jgi:16S rRNA (guanine527-N7)-methyltransferase
MLTHEQFVLLTNGARLLNVELAQDHIAQVAIYLEELKRWAKIVNLVSQSDPEIIIRKHILDSLAALAILPPYGRLLDLGSGAGFPGLPLAIANPALAVTLLEPRRKRVNFLKEVIRKTNLTNTHAYEGRAEDFAGTAGWQSAFDIVITRATWNIREFLIKAAPFVAGDGILAAMKGKNTEELQPTTKDRETANLMLKTEHRYTLPYGNERRSILLFTKKVSRDT